MASVNKSFEAMKFKANAFPIIQSIPNPNNHKDSEKWDSLGEAISSKIPMNDRGQFHGILQTFSDGRLLEERQYQDGIVVGFSVFYGTGGMPMSARLNSMTQQIARFNFL